MFYFISLIVTFYLTGATILRWLHIITMQLYQNYYPQSVMHVQVYISYRDERVQHYLYLYLYLLTIWIICIRTRTGRGLTRKWAGFNLEVGRVVLKWAGL